MHFRSTLFLGYNAARFPGCWFAGHADTGTRSFPSAAAVIILRTAFTRSQPEASPIFSGVGTGADSVRAHSPIIETSSVHLSGMSERLRTLLEWPPRLGASTSFPPYRRDQYVSKPKA